MRRQSDGDQNAWKKKHNNNMLNYNSTGKLIAIENFTKIEKLCLCKRTFPSTLYLIHLPLNQTRSQQEGHKPIQITANQQDQSFVQKVKKALKLSKITDIQQQY
eukprot:TRINITY_DN9046_c2_g2_i1.p1 TRINITY_DN9046_c2_g2~~TRINITY_DN9046_c2_g2_i1.p1  ORF type:complete len:104 (-),score=6.73 TRINITY_DN9046_c2_g2_i1:119-430(-)